MPVAVLSFHPHTPVLLPLEGFRAVVYLDLLKKSVEKPQICLQLDRLIGDFT